MMTPPRNLIRRQLLRRVGLETLERRDLFAVIPTGFTETQVGAALDAPPVSLVEAPDGRLFVTTERDNRGAVRVVKNGALLNTPALQLTVVGDGEFGMVGVLLDPNFSQNGYMYVIYTTEVGGRHNRLSRFQFQGDTAPASSERVLFDFSLLGSGTVHNGGGMAFGPDGKLYVGVGDNANSANARTLDNQLGKIIRINADGSIPTDNPFYNQATGNNRAIYAIGVRNPYSMDVDPVTGRIFFNDVGPAGPEEINEVKRGADYAWPIRMGNSNDSAHTNPVYSYRHNESVPSGCAITGGSFSRPSGSAIPAQYGGKYYFADYCGNWINALDVATGAVTRFASDVASGPVSVHVDDKGAVYYLSRATRTIKKIEYTAGSTQMTITQQPQNVSVAAGSPATFRVEVGGATPTSYRWQKRIGTGTFQNISGATSSTYTIPATVASDDNTSYRVIITSDVGTLTSNIASLTVITGRAPQPVISTPAGGSTYAAGETITFSGFATDPDITGNLPPSSLTWEVTFQHDDHNHPQLAPFSGSSGGSFVVPIEGETSANVWFRIHLTATDSTGLSASTFRDVFPRKSQITITSNVPGIELLMDGTPVATPYQTDGVVNVLRSIGAPVSQSIGGRLYRFVRWSHGGERVQTISTAATNQTYTAIFEEESGGGGTDPSTIGLVTHLKLDEGQGLTAFDTAPFGTADQATLTNGATWSTAGVRSSAVRFDGVNDYVSIPNSKDINDRDTAKTTIAFWFKADDVNKTTPQLLYKQSGSSRGLNVYLHSGRLYVGGWSDKANWAGTYLSTNQISSNQWHHVALVLDATATLTPDRLRGYVDGRMFASGQAATVAAHLGKVSMGVNNESTRYHTGNSGTTRLDPFAGLIDDVRIYDRPLTASEVTALTGNSSTPASYKLRIDDVRKNEGNSGLTPFEFTISLDRALPHDLEVRVNTADESSATANSDYQPLINQIVVIPAGRTTTTVTTQVLGDALVESNETFSMRISNPVLVTDGHGDHEHNEVIEIEKGIGVGTIVNDDSTSGGGDVSTVKLMTHLSFDEGNGVTSVDKAPFGTPDVVGLVNGATWSTEGVGGGSVRFDGMNDFVSLADSVDLNDRVVSQTTISLWFKADDVNRSGKQVLFKQNGNTRGLNIYLEAGRLYVGGFADDTGWAGTFISTNAVRSGQWQHVALVLDGTSQLAPNALLGYLDGALFGSGNGSWVPKHLGNVSLGALDQATRFHSGNSGGTSAVSAFKGQIDEFRVYHRRLTDNEIAVLASNAGSQTLSVQMASSTTALFAMAGPSDAAARWRMDVNGDGQVSALDALRVINFLAHQRRNGLAAANGFVEGFDVNDDSLHSAADALAIINHLSREVRAQVALGSRLEDEALADWSAESDGDGGGTVMLF